MFVPSQGWEEAMDLGLKDKKALVTGASRGSGYATALALSGEAR
jgi:NADP-dependent 3-hydroxy acid dehydrogenase YdfG